MLPTNVMSFMKKMVAQDEAQTQNAPDTGGTFGKLKQTLSSSLLTAQDKVNKMSPRPSLVPMDTDALSSFQESTGGSPLQQQQQQQSTNQLNNNNNNNNINKAEPGKPPSRAGACRVCLKSFKPEDYSKTCYECQQRVCEDCASYSKLDESEDPSMWRCSVCRRKMASRVCIQQDSTDSMLDVPVLEALQRRHSDAKLGSSTQTLAPSNGAALAPPRSPELRRHSDVSPASLKELEKLKGAKTPGGDGDWRKGGRSVAPSRSSSPPRQGDMEVALGPPMTRMASRRGSRIARQHSYDDDMKDGLVGGAIGAGGVGGADLGLGLPASMPRRKSAYDVFAPGILQAAAQSALARSPAEGVTPHIAQPGSRRPSFRVPHPSEMDIPTNDDSPSSPDKGSPTLGIDDDRRMRRRGSQLPDLAALRDRGALPPSLAAAIPPPMASFTGPNLEDLEAPRRQTSMDGEAIKIVIHDVDSGPICSSKRRIVLRKDPTDKAHRTRGFGMRVVGGKTGADGRLFAYIVWTVPGGPAEKNGLQQGDKILEWNSMSLIDRSFEEVCSIMDRTGDIVELLVEHATDFRMCDLFDENLPPGNSGGNQSGPRKSGDGPVGLGLVADPETTDKSPASPTRRKLPKTPEQIAREKQVTGRVQIQVWYHAERTELVVSLMAADDLALRDEAYGHGVLPEAYAKVRILPKTGDGCVQQTEVSRPSQNPIWNATLTFGHVKAESLMDRYIEIQLWDLVPHTESIFLGECNIEMQQAFLEDRALWCRLDDPKGLRGISMSKSPSVSPRGSIGGGDLTRLIRRDYNVQRSMSDDVDSIGDGTSLLHPDHAWVAGSRRGSSQSETLEVEVYQLGKDFSRSLPGSRRSSFQDRENKEEEMVPPSPSYMTGRRRSSVARRDPDEILKSLKAVRGELGRAMSLNTEPKRMGSRRASRTRKDSVMEIPEILPIGIGTNATSPPSDDESKKIQVPRWKGSGGFTPMRKQSISILKQASSVSNVNKIGPEKTSIMTSAAANISQSEPYLKLGPGQVHPKGYRLTSGRYGELKMGFLKIKGTVEVEVICARNIVPVDCETPPDTYVKCYIKDGDRLRHKKKTRVIRHSAEPIYKQIIKYQSSDVFGRNIVIMVWQRCVGFEHNQGLGGTEVNLDKINLAQHIGGWYPLFPMHSFGGSDSDNSP
ncbi:regulating synaptic membrane exocytosis protein 1 isoform X1 [Eupeodes corollae]|uniref:regulating synaptic membrane exocytosis protein 1 isoform X1 n=1 Tax=Eupeodes corollae TaxID=290404 RepID=UPI0024935ADC|nr:regulating synaptic membrane exocytosis protein 1 isoform X1 [Eupeodes corollae]